MIYIIIYILLYTLYSISIIRIHTIYVHGIHLFSQNGFFSFLNWDEQTPRIGWREQLQENTTAMIWLVVSNMNFMFHNILGVLYLFIIVHKYLVGVLKHVFFSPYIGNNNPNWRTHIFQRGRSTTNQSLIPLFPVNCLSNPFMDREGCCKWPCWERYESSGEQWCNMV